MALLDSAILSGDATFTQRVRSGIISAAVSISNEDPATTNHAQRFSLAVQVLSGPDGMKSTFAAVVAVDTSVISDATVAGTVTLTTGNVATQAALVTDTHINNAISSIWNSFFTH